jgi:uncharacterized protein involved in outer membrane biogenesis
MRSLRWVIVAGSVVIGLVVLAIAIGVIMLNTYIHSPAFKTEVESRAGDALGGAVQIQAIDFDILHGVKLQGLVTQIDPSHAGGQGALQVNVASVNCTYSWTELLSRRLRLTGVTLDKPNIVLTKQATAPSPSATTPPVTSATPSGSVTTSSSTSGTAMPFQFVLDQVKVNEGVVSVRDATGAPVVDLRGVNASADTSGYFEGRDVTGTLKITDIVVPPNMHITNFSTPFSYSSGGMQAKPFDASAFGGSLAGDYVAQNASPSILNLNAKGLDVSQLTAATISNSSAKLSGSLDLQSKWRGVETGTIDGEGDAQLINGKLAGVHILQELSGILKVKELNEPVINKAQTHFLIQNRQTKFIGLQLESPIFKITGDGVIGFDGSLNANLVLILTRDAMAKLPKQLAASFVGQQDGTGSIAFQVTGTTTNPQTDLPTRLLMQNTQIKNVINKALNKFFH